MPGHGTGPQFARFTISVMNTWQSHHETFMLAMDLTKIVPAHVRTRRPWWAVSINKAIDTWAMALADAHAQGLVTRDAAEHIAHVSARHKQVDTYTRTRGGTDTRWNFRRQIGSRLGVGVVGSASGRDRRIALVRSRP